MPGYKRILSGLEFVRLSERNPISLLWDYLWYRHSKGITLGEYHKYQFDSQPDSFKKSFLGRNEQRFYLDYLNPKKYYVLARNKYLTHLLLDEYAIAKAKLYCYYNPEGRYNSQKRTSNDISSTIAILKEAGVSSCVIKATEDSHGNNVFAVTNISYTESDAVLTLSDSTTIGLSSILCHTALVFEEIIHQTEQFNRFNQSSVNTVRLITCLYPDSEAKVVAAFIKIGRNGAFVDNAGSGGNVDAGVDVETGLIYNPIIFSSFRNTTKIEKHPDSKCQLNNVVIENWEHICKEVCKFQQAIPFLKAIGWDIAITDDGPKVIEMNDFWDTTGQLFIGKGWREQIRQCYFAWEKHNSKYNISYIFGRLPLTLSKSRISAIVNKTFDY